MSTGDQSLGALLSDLFDKIGVNLPLPAILQDVSVDPSSLKLDSASVSCSYKPDGYGTFTLAGSKTENQWAVAFGIEADLGARLPFPSIPLLSAAVTPLEIDKICVLVTGATVPGNLPADPFGSGLTAGISIRVVLKIGSHSVDKTVRILDAAKYPSVSAGSPIQVPNVGWLKISQSFGPIDFDKLGLGFLHKSASGGNGWNINLNPVFSVKLPDLAVTLDGLSLDTLFKNPSPADFTCDLNGLLIACTSNAVAISGEFLHQHTTQGDSYGGAAFIKFSGYELAGLGEYLSGANPSLFLYLLLDSDSSELGIPPFFVVKGLAGGFGYNYQLNIPSIDKVADFPFVQQAISNNVFGKAPKPADVLAKLGDAVTANVGEVWLAAGIRFSSFELLSAFALLTAQFGTNLEFALLGVASLSVPPDVDEPIAQAQLALEASYSTSSEVLRVEGQLTPDSYILAKACRLTGGFAFCMWFGEDHAGDFVVTLGGYNPRFQKPPHYPDEPRLGFKWEVSSQLHVEGGGYFALTPHAIMAGGSLNATFQSGGLHAWFDVDADFLMIWKPFYYEADLGVSIGVSYRIKVWFVHVTITVHLGVDLSLHGPPFGGKARFHVGPFHVTISFGDSSSTPQPPITWDEFVSAFLPAKPVSGQISAGKVLKESGGSYAGSIVKANSVRVALATAIPIRTVTYVGCSQVANAPSWSTDIGAAPCSVKSDQFNSDVTIAVQYSANAGDTSKSACDPAEFIVTPILTQSPQSLWGAPRNQGDMTWINPPNQGLIAQTLTGFTVVPAPLPLGHQIGPYPVAELLYSYDPVEDVISYAWEALARPTTDGFDQSQAMAELTSTIASGQASQARSDILQALAAQGLTLPNPDVSQIAQNAANVLLAPPILSLLGEEKV